MGGFLNMGGFAWILEILYLEGVGRFASMGECAWFYDSAEFLNDMVYYNMISSLTHWGRVAHICFGNLTITGSDNGLSPGRRQAIIWTNAGILSIEPLGTDFTEIFFQISYIFIQEDVFEQYVCKMAAILSRPQWVNVTLRNVGFSSDYIVSVLRKMTMLYRGSIVSAYWCYACLTYLFTSIFRKYFDSSSDRGSARSSPAHHHHRWHLLLLQTEKIWIQS